MQVTYEDILLNGTYIGIRMKSQRGRGGVVSDILYRNIKMLNIATDCIRLNLNYHPDLNRTNASATPIFRDIRLENIDCVSTNPLAHGSSYLIEGLPESHIQNLTLRNVTVSADLKEVSCVNVDCSCDKATVVCPTCCKKER